MTFPVVAIIQFFLVAPFSGCGASELHTRSDEFGTAYENVTHILETSPTLADKEVFKYRYLSCSPSKLSSLVGRSRRNLRCYIPNRCSTTETASSRNPHGRCILSVEEQFKALLGGNRFSEVDLRVSRVSALGCQIIPKRGALRKIWQQMEHTKVYPFTVSLPRYASWRKYAQALLKQLKACPACRGAADGFPVSFLPKTHKLPNGKLLIFKGLTSTTDQGTLCTNNEVVEEYDMVSIDPNCSRHGKYSRTAWLRKQSTKWGGSMSHAGVKVRPRQQIVSKARENNNNSRWNVIDKCAHSTGEVGRISSSNHWKPPRTVVSVLTERRGENFEPNCETQIALSTKIVTAKDRAYRSSIVVQNQLNFLGMCNQRKDLVLRRHLAPKSAEESIEERVRESGSMESDESQSIQRNSAMEKREECGAPLTTSMVRKDLRAVPILDFEKDVRKCAETYASQFRRMCRLKELNTKSSETSHQEVEITEDQDKKLLERVAEMDTQFEYKMSSSAEVPFQQDDDHIVDETAGNAGDGSSTCTSNRLSKDDDQLAISEVFNLEGLQQTFSLVERLNKIAYTAKALQSELEDHPVREGTPTSRVQLTQVQVNDRKDARDWLLDTAIEKAIKKLPEESDGGRVRHLVQVFESIK